MTMLFNNMIYISLLFIVLILHLKAVTAELVIPQYRWVEVERQNNSINPFKNRILAEDLVGRKPVYISITSISSRIKMIADTIQSILRGIILPTHIYVFISKEPFMKDEGISRAKIPVNLIELTNKFPVTIVYTNNIGPHRKLLPILAKFWYSDCIIVTLDDDITYPRNTLSELVKYYISSGQDSVVAVRSHRIGLCASSQSLSVSEYKDWPLVQYGVREMLLLPTGTGGVLYRPRFFHPIVFDPKFISVTTTGDDITFRLACMLRDVPVVGACRNSCPDIATTKSLGGTDRLTTIINPSIKRHLQMDNNNTLFNKRLFSSDEIDNNNNNTNKTIVVESKRSLRESLWMINRKGKNNVMWNNAVKYIEKSLEVNFFSIYNFYFLKERGECLHQNKLKKYLCGVSENCS